MTVDNAERVGPPACASRDRPPRVRLSVAFLASLAAACSTGTCSGGPIEIERQGAFAVGGKVLDVLMLRDAGLTGNTHLPFADLNNVAVADLLSKFLAAHGLDGR